MKERNNLLISRVEELLEIERKFHSLFHVNPVPAWLKFITQDDQLVMGLVNASYTEVTGISVNAYLGRHDKDIWNVGTAEEFLESEKHIIRTGISRRIVEKAVNLRTGRVQYWVGWKWPCVHQGTMIGVWGQAEPYPEEFWKRSGEEILSALKEYYP